MAWFKNIFGSFRQLADDDVNGLLTVLLFCILDEGTRQNYRQWLTDQIVNSKATTAHDITLGVFLTLTQQASQKERQGMASAVDETLWKIRNDESGKSVQDS